MKNASADIFRTRIFSIYGNLEELVTSLAAVGGNVSALGDEMAPKAAVGAGFLFHVNGSPSRNDK